jgi:SAM-dependent methyltransferase
VMHMNASDRKRLVRLYEDRYCELGYNVKTVGWGSVESQQLRFRILTEIANLNGSSVCDLGCGFGDLYPFLTKHFHGFGYTGIDVAPSLVNEARRRYVGGEFLCRDILDYKRPPAYDYVLSSGALSFKSKNHEVFVRSMLTRMFLMSRKGLAVNFLSSYVDFQLKKNFHWSPLKALAFGKTLTRYVTIRHDYPLYEFTLYLYRKG